MNFHKDRDIVRLLWQKKRIALEWLYERYGGVVFGLAKRAAPSEEAAEELMVQAFVDIWNQADKATALGGGLLVWVLDVAAGTIRRAGDKGLHLELSDDIVSFSLDSRQQSLLNHALFQPRSEKGLKKHLQLSDEEFGGQLRKTVLQLRGNQKINETISKR